MKKLFLSLFSFLFLSFVFNSIYSYPRYSAYTGDKCMDCHVNPSGGAMRNSYGTKYGKEELNMELFKKIADKMEFSPKITKDITIGGDIRLTQVDNQIPSQSNLNTFLLMQGDLYSNVQINDYLNAFISVGTDIPGIRTKSEVFGMISKLPLNSYFKAGRFTPNYGIKIVEHRAYQRLNILNTPYSADAGFEAGISPGDFSLSAGIFNGIFTEFFDGDPKKMFVASTEYTFRFDEADIFFNIGASAYTNPYSFVDPVTLETVNNNRNAFGGFFKLGIKNRVAILGEFDRLENRLAGNMTRSDFYYGELNIKLVKGIELRGQFERYNRNINMDSTSVRRISVGAAFFPFYGFETEAMVRFVNDETLMPDAKKDEFQWNFHFYF
ncbi:MAG: hypothetical protein IAE65_07770 [Ignavibacteria bacterium]|nr:hypothetical protein [Ignavibacteria bacterium]